MTVAIKACMVAYVAYVMAMVVVGAIKGVVVAVVVAVMVAVVGVIGEAVMPMVVTMVIVEVEMMIVETTTMKRIRAIMNQKGVPKGRRLMYRTMMELLVHLMIAKKLLQTNLQKFLESNNYSEMWT